MSKNCVFHSNEDLLFETADVYTPLQNVTVNRSASEKGNARIIPLGGSLIKSNTED